MKSKSMRTVSFLSLALLLFVMLACHDESLLPERRVSTKSSTTKSLLFGDSTATDSTVVVLPDSTVTDSVVTDSTIVVLKDTMSVALLLQKNAGVTGTLTFELVNSHNEVVAHEVVFVDSIPTGTHWHAFNTITFDSTSLIGEKCKVRLKYLHGHGHGFGNAIYWRRGPLHHNLYTGGVSSVSYDTDFAFDIAYAQFSPSFFSKQQQLINSHGVALTSSWTWQEFTLQ